MNRLLTCPRWARGAALAIAIAVLLPVAPAQAHSTLVATEPRRDATVEHPPDRVLLRFDEPVETALGSISVYDGDGRRVDAGEIMRPAPESVAVAIDGELARGTYTVAWRAISADSDPISGAWVFHVEAPGPQPSGIAAEVLEGADFTVSAFYLGGRFLDFLLLLLCVGGIAALVLALGAASVEVRRRLLKVLAGSAIALAIVALLGIAFQGAAAGGISLRQAFSWDVVSSVAETRFGRLSLTRAALAVAIAVLVLLVLRAGGRMSRPVTVAAILLGLGLVVTPGFSGHASVSGAVALVADAAHVQAAAVWVGGLAFVVAALVLARGDRWPLAASSVPRFSTMAVVSVAILLVAGTVNGYLQVRAWRGLWDTEYGVLLLIKVGLVVPLLALGAYNNRYAVPRLRAPDRVRAREAAVPALRGCRARGHGRRRRGHGRARQRAAGAYRGRDARSVRAGGRTGADDGPRDGHAGDARCERDPPGVRGGAAGRRAGPGVAAGTRPRPAALQGQAG